jgi:aspartate carbamoyltransferase catalytic subunit
VQNLLQSITEEPEQLERLRRRHLTSILELDAPLVRQLLRLAARYEAGELTDTYPLRCRILCNLFLDRSQCIGRLAFNAAWLRLGGSLLQFDQIVEQILSRRYAPDEIVELCNNYSDLAVLRTGDPETFRDMLPRFRVPVINAGNGHEEHPAHALADLYLLAKWRPQLLQEDPPESERLAIGIVGDPSRTRTLRSFLRLLALFPRAVDRVVLLQRWDPGFADGQREELEQAGLRIQTVRELHPKATEMEAVRELIPNQDLLYAHLLQPIQVSRMKIVEADTLLRPHAMILNPEIQIEEVANRFNDSPHNGYFAQARGSVYVRMALYAAIMG